MPSAARRLLGGLVGAALGYGLTFLLLRVGVMPLAAVGGGFVIGAGWANVPRSFPWAVAVTGIGIVLAVVHTWTIAPFPPPDDSLSSFVTRAGDWNGPTWIGIILTAALGGLYGGGTAPRRPRAATTDPHQAR